MEKQVTIKNKEKKEKPFKFKNQAAAEKGARDAQRKITELAMKATELKRINADLENRLAEFNTMKYDKKDIVASNLVLASVIMAAAGKPWTDDPFSSVDIEGAIKAFKSCASLLKKEGEKDTPPPA